MTQPSPAAPQRVRGSGRLRAKWLGGRTRLAEFYQDGSAKIRLPDSYDDSMEAVLINISGGLTGGDHIDWRLEAGPSTHLVITTQACERIYKSVGGVAGIDVRLVAHPGARLFWLPQETILFDRAALHRRLEVDLAADSEFVAVESVLLGRQAMGEDVAFGAIRDHWRIRRGGRLIHAEELALSGPIAALSRRPTILGGARAFATVLCISDKAEARLSEIRPLLGDAMAGASCWQGKLVIRMSAPDGFQLRKIMIPVMTALRGGLSLPKAWSL